METANVIERLRLFIEEADSFKGQLSSTQNQTAWLFGVTQLLEHVFGSKSVYAVNFKRLSWKSRGAAIIGGPAFPEESFNPQLGFDRLNKEANNRSLETAKGILLAAKKELEDVGIEGVQTDATAAAVDKTVEIIKISETNFRKLFRKKPENEKEVQEKYEDMLNSRDITFSREKETIEYSSKNYIPDFTFSELDLVTEIKICDTIKREKEIIPEINDDILAYKTKYRNLLFVVYDLGFIRDVDRFKASFEKQDNVIVQVVKH